MGPLDTQVVQLRERYGDVTMKSLPSGTHLVTVSTVRLPAGWSKSTTSIRFLVPAGYPFAALDCFWADQDLTLVGGRIPQAANTTNPIPEGGGQGLWFSWHLAQPWNPNRDTLSTDRKSVV